MAVQLGLEVCFPTAGVLPLLVSLTKVEVMLRKMGWSVRMFHVRRTFISILLITVRYELLFFPFYKLGNSSLEKLICLRSNNY